MATALITGGTGFVGSHVARALAEAGHTVRILHRRSSKLTALEGVRYESAYGDVLEADALREACAGCDWVFHVAAVADYWRADKAHMFKVNVEGTRLVLDAAREAGVKRVVFTSSAAAVGLTPGGTSDESVAFNLPPERFPYGYSKVLAEQVVAEAVRNGQEVVTVNPVVVMGPGDLNQISGSMVIESKRNGRFVPVPPGGAGYVDVRDVARWQLRAAEVGVPGERYLLGTANFGHREWFSLIADVVGVPRPILPLPRQILPLAAGIVNGVRALGIKTPMDGNQIILSGKGVYFKYDKTWAAFGPPQVAMEMSLQDTYAWYRASGVI
ncbi:MAG: NAD-dependent epimerase/dehydratase family protein [Anaerolineae bacterium]|jgi:dihydroflavonol-4-reductase|nr:NAD-dependent epimerase/dehydratase family protein [Anaerolineae bacterium]